MFDIFSLPDFQMPKDFLWGAGYAGHQVEGNNIHSQNWKKEIDQHYAERSGLACNSYELWKTEWIWRTNRTSGVPDIGGVEPD